MKFVFAINTLGPGGTERSLLEMLPYVLEAGIDPVVVCLKSHVEGMEHRAEEIGVPVYHLGTTSLTRGLPRMRRLIARERPNLVHTMLFEADVLGRLASIGQEVRVLTSLVNTSYEPARLADPRVSRLKLEGVRRIDAWTARWCNDHFHAVSEAVKDSAVRRLGLPPEKITVVYRGRDTERLGQPSPQRRKRCRAAFGIPEDAEVLANVGRQEYQKGQRFLLDAVARLRDHRPRLILYVAGKQGTCTTDLKRCTRDLGLENHVVFTGHLEDVPGLLAAADLCVVPSLYEGAPGAILEAMALGLPIVASDIAPLRELVTPERNGILVEPASSESLAAAIQEILEDPSKRNLFGKESREIFEGRFTLECQAERMVNLLMSVATGGGSWTSQRKR